MSTSQGSQNKLFGANTSLYSSLGEEMAVQLEKAIFHTRFCWFEEARGIFEDRFAAFKHVPVVVIEWAELYLQQWRFGDAIDVLESGFQAMKTSGTEPDMDKAEYRLMSIFLGLCEIMGKGRLNRALVETYRMVDWLRNLPVEDYSDIQVHCIRKYAVTTYFVKLHCNKCTTEGDNIPRPSGTPLRTWQGLTDLRASLSQQGRMVEAALLHRAESMALPLVPRIDAHLAILSELQLTSTGGSDTICVRWLRVDIQILLSETLRQAGEIPRARAELQKAEKLANQCLIQLGLRHERLLLSVRWARLLIDWEEMKAGDRYTMSIALLTDMEPARHLRTSSCFDKAAESALEVFRETGSNFHYDEFFRLRKEVGAYQENVSRDLPNLLLWRESQFNETRSLVIDKSTMLSWYDDFLRTYPDFALPSSLFRINRTRELMFLFLGDKNRAEEARMEIEKISPHVPSDVSDRMCWSQPIVCPDTDDNQSVKEQFQSIDEEYFYTMWTDGDADPDIRVARILQKWMTEDLQDGILSAREVCILMKGEMDVLVRAEDLPKETDLRSHLLNDLKGFSETNLLVKVVGNREVTLEKHHWNTRFEILKAWLRRRSSRSSHNGRRYLLLRLQEIYTYTLNYDDPDRAIEEYAVCISMVPNLPKAVQIILGASPGHWHSATSCLFIKRFNQIQAEQGNRKLKHDLLEQAFDHCRKAIDHWGDDATQAWVREPQRCALAEICLMKLEHELAPCAEERRRLQRMGLQNVKVVDDWLRSARQDFPTPEDRVEDARKRDLLTTQLKSFNMYICAMQLILSSGELSPEDSLEFWMWVQRSKARALAEQMAIDSLDQIPPSLVSALEATSKDAYRVLQEEIILRRKLASATGSDRYYLTVELRRKRQAMRKIPDLRQIVDLMEGSPLQIDDLAAFNTESDTSVVLVDWIKVPYRSRLDKETRIVVVTVKAHETPKVHVLPHISGNYLEMWLSDVFGLGPGIPIEMVMRDPGTREAFQNIEGLATPITSCSAPGDLLVLCPTDNLHRIPLHAIEVSEHDNPTSYQPLIHRNPVIYCPSLSVLRHCYWSSKSLSSAAASPSTCDMALFHGIPPPCNNTVDDRYAVGREAISRLAKKFRTQAIQGQSLTRERFTQETSHSSLIHIHSHINLEPTQDALSQYFLHFGTAEKYWILSAKDVLQSLHFPRGSHVTLIACDGARFRIGLGDELLGIVPALLCAGASSVISTLWKTTDAIGATFTKEFYDVLEADGGVVNVAKAFQRAVVRMDKDGEEVLYRWAGFVLHGYWLFGRKEKIRRQAQEEESAW